MKTILLHWGITILQGILIGCLGICIFVFTQKNYPLPGIILVIAGIAGITEWQLNATFNRSNKDFLWSIVTAISGLGLLIRGGEESILHVIVLYSWIFFSGLLLSARGWEVRWVSGLSWAIIAMGVIISFLGLYFGFHAQEISTRVWQSAPMLLIAISLGTLGITKKKIFESF